MSDVAIRIEGLGKRYHIGRRREHYRSLRETLTEAAVAPWRRLRAALDASHGGRNRDDMIWALKDVSLEVRRGEVVGVIGRNGAGKSTLLKILSRITEPTEGRVELHGRVSSLLEVGTGFHPELTGRENIYLNGAILGMKKVEIDRSFDEIVAFAEIEKFLDTPVKRYSSGMHVRLAFAVAAHLEPEILLVDEVLAVGDAAFQKKCLGKMGEVASEGRTVLFVSHNLAAVTRLCARCVWVDAGVLRMDGMAKQTVVAYLDDGRKPPGTDSASEWQLTQRENPYPPHELVIQAIRLFDSDGSPRRVYQMGEPLTLEVDVKGMGRHPGAMLGVTFKTQEDQWLASINTGMKPPHAAMGRRAKETLRLSLRRLPFTPGTYWIAIAASTGQNQRVDYVDRAAELVVEAADVYGSGFTMTASYGFFYLDGEWEISD